MSKVIIYGSYGYTGRLIVEVCKRKNLNVILSGRNQTALEKQHQETGYPFEVVAIGDTSSLEELVAKGQLVIHCAGPFQYTALQMAKACLKSKVHYTDITGEIGVFESLAKLDEQAKAADIMIMPGVGFDVVPSDCMAVFLKKQLPSATHLQLAFTSLGSGPSRGTKRTSIESLGQGSAIRKNGKIISIPIHERFQEIDFGEMKMMTACIPWGDVATAYRSTGILNIEVYMGVSESMMRSLKMSKYLNWLLRMRWVKNYLLKQTDKKAPGPSQARREKSKTLFWGKVWDDNGNTASAILSALNGYSLTAETSVLIAEKILDNNYKTGYQTPAMMYGEDLILEIPESIRKSD